MKPPIFRRITGIDASAVELERWHMRPGALQRLSPPWERLRVVEEPVEISDRARAVLKVKMGPLWMTWVAEHQDCQPGASFTDVQVDGPFAYWKHTHHFRPIGAERCELEDEVHYRLPLGILGKVFGGAITRTKLERMFRYRHALTKLDLERLPTEPTLGGEAKTVLVTGATGMVGSALEAFLRMRGIAVRRVTRSPSRAGDVRWDPAADEMDLPKDAKIDAVVHLAGESIAGGRWSEARKRRIIESRRQGTRLLCKKLAALDRRPEVLVNASGVNYYRTGTPDAQDESAPRGSGFLSDVCDVWEGETATAADAGIRTVRLRLGIVLSPAGGALAKMLPPFQFGLGGRLGAGSQHMPWVALDDVIDVMYRALCDDRYEGAVNVVAPDVITNAQFTRALAATLHRPRVLPVPAFALKLAFGEQMAEETLLADLCVAPAKLQALGYAFRFPCISGALAYLLGRAPNPDG